MSFDISSATYDLYDLGKSLNLSLSSFLIVMRR